MTELRKFGTGATRDNEEGKLDYIRALSPIVLKRFVQYMDKHRNLPDGTKRDFDNWKEGIPREICMSSLGRHYWAAWLISHGFQETDNDGPVELEDALCGIMFNTMCILLEELKERNYGKGQKEKSNNS